MKEILKNPYVIAGIVMILWLIATAWNIGAGSWGKLILQPWTTDVINEVNSEVGNIIPE